MSEPASISSGIAGRYATAVFELARDDNGVDALTADVEALEAAMRESGDLRGMVASPLLDRAEQRGAITAIAEAMELNDRMRNTLALMADKRQLFVLPQLLDRLREMVARHRGEVTAHVASAKPLSDDQIARLADVLKKQAGSDVNIKTTVDEGLIGGLVVKLGSRMIDTSIAAKLQNLQNTMKEVG